eukprot:4425272-Prymnesium_polylepis.1
MRALERSVSESNYSLRRFLVTQSKLFLNANVALVDDGLAHMQRMNCSPEQVLVKLGEPGQGLFIVTSGVANCYIEDVEAPNGLKLVKVVQSGENFGEVSLLEGDGAVTRAQVHAGHDCRALFLGPDNFDQLCSLHAEFSGRLLRMAPKYYLITFFVELPLLKNAPLELVEQLAASAKQESFADGKLLQKEGKPLEALFFLKEGHVREGSSRFAAEEGFFCGGRCILADEEAAADVVCEGSCTVFRLSKVELEKLRKAHPSFLEHVQTTRFEALKISAHAGATSNGASTGASSEKGAVNVGDNGTAILEAIASLAASVEQMAVDQKKMSQRLESIETTSGSSRSLSVTPSRVRVPTVA